MVIIKKVKDQKTALNEYCGEVTSILAGNESPEVSIAIAYNIKPTLAHYHLIFQEIYFVLDGEITMEFYDEVEKKHWQETLRANELCSIETGVHHRIIKASEKNRLAVICAPAWFAEDEYPSTILKR